jgi:hypothetical protein
VAIAISLIKLLELLSQKVIFLAEISKIFNQVKKLRLSPGQFGQYLNTSKQQRQYTG